jgi:hypothetical protein
VLEKDLEDENELNSESELERALRDRFELLCLAMFSRWEQKHGYDDLTCA